VAQSWADGETPGQPDKVPKVLRLYRHALHCAQAPGFDTGGDPYQSAVLLIQLRNTLVHFVPETHAHDSVHKLETGLRKRFDENRQAIGTNFVTEVVKDDKGDLISKVVKVIPNVQERLGFSKAAFDKFVPPGRDNPPCKKNYD